MVLGAELKRAWPMQTFAAPIAGNYRFTVAGAQGGNSDPYAAGGLGAIVTATVFLAPNQVVPLIVAGQGAGHTFVGQAGTGGGGLSAVYTGPNGIPSVVAGLLFLSL